MHFTNLYINLDIFVATKELDKSITFVLSDKDILTDEVKLKYVNLVKMLIYAYVNVTIAVNNKDPSNTVYKKVIKNERRFTRNISYRLTIRKTHFTVSMSIW